ncbi:MAG TPA: enoyl-ACP reductase FabV [Candidatus Acidoferrales bacterium]|jgi:enoyl-[acyl-carrier protein] reductase/trans-2-enoyl-CoA reductase (NAD+)|nr:enoyl-ACP reductase FabV [Candidatus Acidoferrales bacterium]
MPEQVIKRKSRGFICINAHPEGCRRNVERQVEAIRSHAQASHAGMRNVLVIGASTGYGLASRIAAAWGYSARTLGVFFERPPEEIKTASAGFYNTAAFHDFAGRDSLFSASINGDAFSDELKRQAIEIIRRELKPLDLIVYSLASPRRVHPKTGQVFNSALKPVGQPFTNKTIELDSEKVVPVTLQPATPQEVADTVAVMGGEDWEMWISALLDEGLLAQGARTIAYSYIGPEVTWPIYRDGTIGQAKKDLDAAALRIRARLNAKLGGDARVSVNKAVVTQASAAIPVVPLYLSLLPLALRARNLDEGPIEQMRRLFLERLAEGVHAVTDEAGRIRLDDRELRPDVQADVTRAWPGVTTENLRQVTAFGDYQREFRSLFGFEVDGVDYEAPVETDISW